MASTTRIRLNASYWRHERVVAFSEDVVPSSLFLKHHHYLVVDIETQQAVQDVGGWEHVDRLKVSVACAYDSKTQKMMSFTEAELPALISLCMDRLVIGYNVRGFDLKVLVQYGLDLKRVDVFDIMYDLEALTRQPFLKLDAVARGTLGETKSADGLQAIQWWKEGKVQQIIDYCLQDVKVTHDIFTYGRKNGFVKIQRSVEQPARDVAVQWN